MQDTNHFLKAALQVGPWRVTRRVLLFVVVFCLVIIVFGSLILKTHAFDGRDDDDWDDDDDDDDEWRSLSSGDSLMLVLMGLAGMAGLAASAGCLLATSNTPRPLGEGGSSVFTLSGVNTHQPVTPRPSAPESLPPHPENPLGSVPPPSSTVPPTPTKVMPQGNGYPHSPIFPRNPNYPPEPPPSYTAPSYPEGGRAAGRRMARTMPPNVSRVVSSPPNLHTVADLPPPYAPVHAQPQPQPLPQPLPQPQRR